MLLQKIDETKTMMAEQTNTQGNQSQNAATEKEGAETSSANPLSPKNATPGNKVGVDSGDAS